MKKQPKQPKLPSIMREFVALNIQKRMDIVFNDVEGKSNRIKKLAAESELGYGTIVRALNTVHGPTLDSLAYIAEALDLEPYQLLIRNLDAHNPQIVHDSTPSEKRFYEVIGRSKRKSTQAGKIRLKRVTSPTE